MGCACRGPVNMSARVDVTSAGAEEPGVLDGSARGCGVRSGECVGDRGGGLHQRIPPARVPVEVAAALTSVLGDLTIVTAGTLTGLASQDVDHIACSRHFVADEVWGVDRVGDGGPLSDHHLVAASLRWT